MLQMMFMSAAGAMQVPTLRMAFIAVVLIVFATALTARGLVHGGVASGLFFASTAACIWVLQLGWALAAAGIVFLFVGVVWRVASRNAAPSFSEPSGHKSSGFIWPGLALLAAPFANAFVLMPVLRQSMH